MSKKNNENENIIEKNYSLGDFLWETVKIFILAVVIIIPIRLFLFQPFFVEGSSMIPNFKDGDYLIVNEIGYKKTNLGWDGIHLVTVRPFKELKRGDIVVFHYPRNPRQFFIKRVIGLPGEEIQLKSGYVYVYNKKFPKGKKLNESQYLKNNVKTISRGQDIFVLNQNEYFVLGDNRMESSDSRVWGPVNKKYIVGKVIIRAWPLSNLKIFLHSFNYYN